jgi:hypothetical protein
MTNKPAINTVKLKIVAEGSCMGKSARELRSYFAVLYPGYNVSAILTSNIN